MKRKEFLNRLLKISQQHESLNPNYNSNKSKQDKQKKLKPQPIITKMMPIELVSNNLQCSSIKSREMVVIKQQLVTSKVLIHANGNVNSTYRRIASNRRMKTTPTHSKMNASQIDDITKLIQQNYQNTCLYDQVEQRKHHYVTDANLSQTLPHYLEIKELQPQIMPKKQIKEMPNHKRISTKLNERPKQFHFKKHSLTEPAESPMRKDNNTERKLQVQTKVVQNRSNVSQQFKKYSSMNRQKLHHSNKMKLSVRKEINKNYNKHFNPPPRLTAKSYIIYQIKQPKEQSKVIASFNSKNTQEVASLTKIMTCILILEICKQFEVNRDYQQITIGKLESNVGGTTASLAYGEIYTIQQLLLGLMLPSGNDASMALAIWGGRKLLQRQSLELQLKYTKMECYNRFIQQMNAKARQLGMNKTNYANSHGLINPNNKSTAYDIAILCQYAISNQSFRNIVQCKQYKGAVRYNQQFKKNQQKIYKRQSQQTLTTEIEQQPDRKSISPTKQFTANKISQKRIGVQWENTHKLLHLKPKQYLGIKTGYTTSAGPCLSSLVCISNRNFIIIVLGCGRTQILRRWLIKHQNLKKKKIKQPSSQLQQQQDLQQKQVQFLLDNMKVDEEKQD